MNTYCKKITLLLFWCSSIFAMQIDRKVPSLVEQCLKKYAQMKIKNLDQFDAAIKHPFPIDLQERLAWVILKYTLLSTDSRLYLARRFFPHDTLLERYQKIATKIFFTGQRKEISQEISNSARTRALKGNPYTRQEQDVLEIMKRSISLNIPLIREAIDAKSFEGLSFLLRIGKKPVIGDLFFAINKNTSLEIIRLLVEYGCPCESSSLLLDLQPIYVALFNNQQDTSLLLLQAGVNVHQEYTINREQNSFSSIFNYLKKRMATERPSSPYYTNYKNAVSFLESLEDK